MSKILEEAENLQLDRIATVQTARGEEYSINVDKAVCALADLLCEYDNEKRFGWELEGPWFEGELRKLRSASVVAVFPEGGDEP